jgi:hypothetical protein
MNEPKAPKGPKAPRDPIRRLALHRVDLGIAWIRDGVRVLGQSEQPPVELAELQANVALGALSQLRRSILESH